MVTAKCNRCLGSGEGSTFSEASQNINHAIGLSRGIKCGRNYNQIVEVGSSKPKPKKPKAPEEKVSSAVSKPSKE